MRQQNRWQRVYRQEKHITKANLKFKNFRFHDHFAKTKLSYCMMGFSLLKSVLSISLFFFFFLIGDGAICSFLKILFVYLFLAALGLCCCAWAFSSCSESGWGYSSLRCTGFSLRWLLLLWSTGSRHTGSVVVVRGLSSCGSWALEHRLSSCGTRDQLLWDMWGLPGPGLGPVPPALAGGFLITAPPRLSISLEVVFSLLYR